MPRVRLPDGRLVRFPDEMTTQDIEAAVMTLMGPAGPVPASEQPPLERPSTSGFLKKLAASGIETAGSVVPGMARLLKTAVTDPREAGRMMVEGIAQPIEALAGDPLGTIYEHPGAPLGVAANIAGAGLGLRTAIRTPSAAVRGGVALQRMGEHVPSSITPTFSVPYTLARAVTGPTLRTTGRALERGGRLFGGNVPFHERPLYEQMGQLPETSAPSVTRFPGPPQHARGPMPGAAPRLNKGGDPSGRAAKDLVERGVPSKGPPTGITERRHAELLKTRFGGTQEAPAATMPAAWEPFVSKSKAPAASLTAGDVEALAVEFKTTPEAIREAIVTARRGRSGTYKAAAEVRKELERLMKGPD